MLDMGIYQQLEYLGRAQFKQTTDPEERFKAFARDMRLILTIQASMLNFSEWKCVPDPDSPDRYRIEVRGIEGVADGVFIASAGLINELAQRSREKAAAWVYERPEPDLFLFRMTGTV